MLKYSAEMYGTELYCNCNEVNSRFRGSVICGVPLVENKFQVAKFYLKSESFLVFLSGPKWPRGHMLSVLASESVLSGP